MTEPRLVTQRLGAQPESAGRGGMFVAGGQFDRSAIPTDPAHRVLRVPIPPDSTGRPCYDRDLLWPAARKEIKSSHDAKVQANLIERDALLTLCQGDLAARKEVEALCAQDPVYWINHFVWIIDPRLGEKATVDPFVLYETQEREARFFVDEFIAAEEMLWLIEKSRAWGATWLMVALTAWGFLYRNNWSVLFGAPNQDDVDKGGAASDHNSIFGKVRFLLKHLPPWQVPVGLLESNKHNKNFMLKHPNRDNAIHGRQFCSNWGRSLRFLYTVGDEAAHSINFRAASVNYGNTSNRNIALSTHKGGATEFAQMVNAAKEEPSADRVVHTLFWPENPQLDTDVYWGWRQKYGWEKTAQERDIDQQGSVGLAVWQDFDPVVNVVTERKEVRDAEGAILVEARAALDYDPNLPLGVSCDPGFGPDPFSIVWWQPHREEKLILLVDAVQYEGRPGPFFVPFLLGHIPEVTLDGKPFGSVYEYDRDEMEIIARHKKWGALSPGLCYGDCYGASKAVAAASGLSIYETWERYGLETGIVPVKITNKEDAVARVGALMGRIRIAGRLQTQRTQSKQTPTLVEAIKMYSWVQRESPEGLPLARVPKHNAMCHYADCLQFIAKFEDADDPRVLPLAPIESRDMRLSGMAAFLRAPRTGSAVKSSYDVPDDPICRG